MKKNTWNSTKRFLLSEKGILTIWLLSAIIFALVKYLIGYYNNYKIFENVFWHAIQELPLYDTYPDAYYDINHYGILFSLIIAPFAVLPQWLGIILWITANTCFLFYALKQLPISWSNKSFIYWFSLYELMEAQTMQQFNISVAACIVLAFVFIEQKKDFWAAAIIMAGTFIKIYPIVGLAFFFFSKKKPTLIFSCLLWAVIFFVLPMLYTNPEYVINQYSEWFVGLTSKNGDNLFAPQQNISLLGFVRKIPQAICGIKLVYSDLWLIIPGLVLFFIPYFRTKQYQFISFRLMLLANVLLFTTLFSTGTESSGYILAMIGVALWYICSPSKHKKYNYYLMLTTLILVGLANTEIIPRTIYYNFILPFVMKSWMCIIVWGTVCYEMICLDFAKSPIGNGEKIETHIN